METNTAPPNMIPPGMRMSGPPSQLPGMPPVSGPQTGGMPPMASPHQGGNVMPRSMGSAQSPPSNMGSLPLNIRPMQQPHMGMPVLSSSPSQMHQSLPPNASQMPGAMLGPPNTVAPPGPPVPSQAMSHPAPSSQPAPAGPQLPQRNMRVTSVPKPSGIDPLLILQERENRYIEFSENYFFFSILDQCLICYSTESRLVLPIEWTN